MARNGELSGGPAGYAITAVRVWIAPRHSAGSPVPAPAAVGEAEPGPARKAGILLSPDRPWETRAVAPIDVALDPDRRVLQLWYAAWSGFGRRLCYAEIDPATFRVERPRLGQVELGGRATNVLDLPGGTRAVMRDERTGRYVALWHERSTARREDEIWLALSDDGVRWAAGRRVMTSRHLGDTHKFGQWSETDGHVLYLRPRLPPDRPTQRTVARLAVGSKITTDYPGPKTPLEPVLEPDAQDPPGTELYYLAVWRERGALYGMVPVLIEEEGDPEHGTVTPQLVRSTDDGHSWSRLLGRRPFIARGGADTFDRDMIYPVQPVRVGPFWWTLYGGWSVRHHAIGTDARAGQARIGLAHWWAA